MWQLLKRTWWAWLLVGGVQSAAAFSIKGPFETYQVEALFYASGDLGGPHNLGEEYRRNTPVMYYTVDQNFLDYFGSNGVAAVEAAFAILNSVTNVDSYSSNLSEWPLEAQRFNYQAQALQLTDLKSVLLSGMIEEMGLAEAERFVWTLRDRDVGAGGCPADVSYFVIKRNFNPVFTPLDELQPSSYVNGALYSYNILEFCQPGPFLADAVEFSVDPIANPFSAVSGFNFPVGSYYTGLTRDDVGGLRYLLRTNNVNVEDPGAGTLTAFTNTSVSQLLFTSNLTLLVNLALTNNPVTLAGLIPGLVISGSTPIFTNVVSTNVQFYFTNFPWAPFGSPATLVSVTNFSTNVATWFNTTFANVVTNTYYTNGFLSTLQTNVAPCLYVPPGNLCTNVTSTRVLTPFINGTYFLLPPNSDCGVSIVSTQLTFLSAFTNATLFATNVDGQSYSQTDITYVTNQALVIHPVPCLTSNTEPRQGIKQVRFVRYDGAYDTLLDVYNYPITNTYQLVSVPLTNGVPTPRTVVRPVFRPDIIISAMDLTTEQSVPVRGGSFALTGFGFAFYLRNLPFVPNSLPGLYGPGTIAPNVQITFNKVGPLFLNFSPFSLDEATQIPLLNWGSFDGSTNLPVVYPNGTSIQNYEQGLYLNVLPPYLPPGFLTTTPVHTNYYSAQLTATSYTPSFVLPATWSLAPGSAGLPTGLVLNSTTGIISGTPTAVGTFDFVVRATDTGASVFDRAYYITVSP